MRLLGRLLKKIFSWKFISLGLLILIFLYLFDIQTRLLNIEKRFGGVEKLKCSEEEVQTLMNKMVVRVVGSYSEGSGFPVSEDTIITNFHVIDGEPAPKIVFADGTIETSKSILADKEKDIATLLVDRKLDAPPIYGWFGTSSVAPNPTFGEPVYAAGYPYGSAIPGDARIIKGTYNGVNYQKVLGINVIEASIQLNPGMSGGPLVNSCGQVLGISTAGIAGLSTFLDIEDVQQAYYNLSDDPIAKIEIDTETPEGVVRAFYTYIKARDLEKAFDLISSGRRSTISSFEEWTKGYRNTLQVELVMSKVDEEDENKVLIKIASKDWVDGEMVLKYFEGEWEVIEENGDLRLNESNIKEVLEPSWDWFYTDES